MNEFCEMEAAYWAEFVGSLPEGERPSAANVTASMAGNAELADALLGLYLSGRKTAGSGLVKDYEHSEEPLPQVGNYWIVLRGDSTPGCILRTTRVVTHPFSKVPVEVAVAEGEGDRSLRHWQEVHRAFFSPFLQLWGIEDLEEAEVVTEFFEVVHR